MLTIKDIAKMAGVSSATVSKVINNTGRISPKTVEKVMKVINDTGYQPSYSAKTLATKKTNLIGLVYAGEISVEFNHPFFSEVINNFKNTIGELGYDILIFSNKKFSKDKNDYLSRSKYFHLDGCLIIAGDYVDDTISRLDNSDIPCVGVDIELNGPKSSYVTTDNWKVAEKVVEYFYLNSIREVAFLGGNENSIISNNRRDSFLRNTKKYGMSVREDWVQNGDYFEDSGYHAMKRILAKQPYPEGVFAVSDMMALGAIKAMKEVGIRVPEDIKIIGCDDVEACRYSNPALATVRQDKEKIGKLAAHMLNDLINGIAEPSSTHVDPELVIRESAIVT